MDNVKNYIESGIIEAYVLGLVTDDESLEVERLAKEFSVVQDAINRFSINFEKCALLNPEKPEPLLKPMVMASIDYMQRLSDGETPSFPPLLNNQSVTGDYAEWICRKDMQPNPEVKGIFAKIIGYSDKVITAIVWLEDMAPLEVHHNEYERFLIIEGFCEITIGHDVHALKPGSYLEIPLHVTHSVKVTSSLACKVLLQRVAA